MFDSSFMPVLFLYIFFKVEISSHKLTPLFRPGSVHSVSASWDDCDWVFLGELRVSSFPEKIPTHCLDSDIACSDFDGSKPICVFKCNLPPALLAEWLGSFTCHCSNTGLEWTLNKSQHTKLTLEKKILPPLLPEFKLATFWSRKKSSVLWAF